MIFTDKVLIGKILEHYENDSANPEYLRQMADMATGWDEREPWQLDDEQLPALLRKQAA